MSDDEIERMWRDEWDKTPLMDGRSMEPLQRFARAVERAARAAAFREAAEAIPTTWLDPLLSGPDRISPLPYNGPAMERFLHALRDRLRARAEGDGEGGR